MNANSILNEDNKEPKKKDFNLDTLGSHIKYAWQFYNLLHIRS